MLLRLDGSRFCLPKELVSSGKLGRWVVLCPKDGVLEVKSTSNRASEDIVYEIQYLTYRKWLTISDEMFRHLGAERDDSFEITLKGTSLYIRKIEAYKKADD